MNARLASLFLLLFANACMLSSAAETFMTKRESFAAAEVSRAILETGAGNLTVTGRRGLSTIEVVADYRGHAASKKDAQALIDNLKLTMEVRGDTFYLKTENKHDWNWGKSGWIGIDLNITVPSRVTLDIDDGSGSLSVAGIDSDVRLEDGSGEIEISGIKGNLYIDDGSGSIRVSDVEKNIEIEDGSGGIVVEHVGGDLHIKDGSGSIEVNDVRGRLVVPNDGSGSINHRDVRGGLDIPRRRR